MFIVSHYITRFVCLGFSLLSIANSLAAEAAPPPPKEYNVQLRYRIVAGRNDRVAQFFALTNFLESIGFNKDFGPPTEPEDVTRTRMTGTIAAADALKILNNPHVKSLKTRLDEAQDCIFGTFSSIKNSQDGWHGFSAVDFQVQ